MSRSSVEVTLEYEVRAATHFCLNIQAAHWPAQDILSEALIVSPDVLPRCFTGDGSGNRFLRFDALPGPLRVSYRAAVKVRAEPPAPDDLAEVPVSQVPDEVLHYLLPTRYCESDVLGAVAQQMFGGAAPGMTRVREIVRWIQGHIAYAPGSTTTASTAQHVFLQRAGVCRDFAHLGIAFCQALNIPARLVAGYVRFENPPQDFHAVFEAWLGGRWVMFDATGMAPVERLVRIGTGRDARDVAFATYFGDVLMTRLEVLVREDEPTGCAAGGSA